VAQLIIIFMGDKLKWQGSPTELLTLLETMADDANIKTTSKAWPKDATWLWKRIAEVRPILMSYGIVATREETRPRTIRLVKNTPEEGENDADGNDDGGDDDDPHDTDPIAQPQRNDSISVSTDSIFPILGERGGNSSNSTKKGVYSTSPPQNKGKNTVGADMLSGQIQKSKAPDTTAFLGGPVIAVGADPKDVRLVTTEDAARPVIATLMSQPAIGMDFETTGLDPHSNRVRLVQLSTPETTYVLDTNYVPLDVLEPLVTGGPIKIAHNASFEAQFLWHHFKQMPYPIFCTMLGDQVLDTLSRGKGAHDLVKAAKEYAGVKLDPDEKKSFQQSDWSRELSPQQLSYAARDSALLLPIYQTIKAKVEALKLGPIVDLEMAALPYVAWMEYSGIGFDKDAWSRIAEEAGGSREGIQGEMDKLAAGITGEAVLVKWNSHRQVSSLLARVGIELENLQESTLKAMKHQHRLIPLLLEYRKKGKAVSTYGENWLDYIHEATGRIHADWQQLGTRAGRMSCVRPNLQNLPGASRYRACFVAGPENCLIVCDYSQIELRVCAEVSGDRAMIEAFNEGLDLHRLTAMAFTGKSRAEDVTLPERNAAKAANFGLIYDMSPRGLVRYAKDGFEVDLSEDQAAKYHRRFFQTYKGVKRWQENQKGRTSSRTILGRRRTFDKGDDGSRKEYFRELYNSPIQGSASDGLKLAMGELWRTRHQTPAFPVLAVHDELVIEVPAGDVEAAKEWLTRGMAKGMEPILRKVKLGDLTPIVGPNWACKVKLA
jgi:DNA polymerase-1